MCFDSRRDTLPRRLEADTAIDVVIDGRDEENDDDGSEEPVNHRSQEW